MKIIFRSTLCIYLVFLVFYHSNAQTIRNEAFESAIEKSQQFIQEIKLKLDIPGMSISVGKRIGKDSSDRKIVHHSATIQGGETIPVVYLEQDLVISICTNKNVRNQIELKEVEAIDSFFFDQK